jgi:RsiW-degrading membrane proteinase PrsW (M82 family)
VAQPQPDAGRAAPPVAPTTGAPAGVVPVSPGYPQYPQGAGNPASGYPYPQYNPYAPYSPYAPYGYGAPGGYPPYGGYIYPYANPWSAYYPVIVVPPRRAPGEIYALVISWIVTVAGGLSIICGLLISLLTFISILRGSNSLTSVDTFVSFLLAPVIGGGFAIYYGIRGIQRKPSPRFTLPSPMLLLGLTVVVYVAAIVIWHLTQSPGPAFLALPLVVLSAAMPALTVLSFTNWRLRNPTSRRHVWMSFIYGSTLAILIALILNTLGEVFVFIFELSLEPRSTSSGNPISPSSPDNIQIIGALLLLSVLAPLVEEGVKPLGVVLCIRRIRSPAGAFLMGLAAGCGFAIFESVSIYIGQGQADWIAIAVERIGSSLLHGVGAGMGALGWYYLINGKGVRLRWWRGVGCIAYALFQHGLFNGLALFTSLPGPVSSWLQHPVYIGQLPLDRGSFIFFIYYAAIIAVLVIVTGRLARGPGSSVPVAAASGNSVSVVPSAQATPVGSNAS